MKILYAYRYGIIGGVSSQLLLRYAALHEAGIRCELFFSQDNGLGQVLESRDGIHFGTETALHQLVRDGRFNAVIIIDSPELLDIARGPFYRRNPVFLDVHTTTATGLAYLTDISLSRLAGVMVPTRYSANLVAGRLPATSSVSVVPNILNTTLFSPEAPSSKDANVKPTPRDREYIWVGKLDLHKNWRLALIYVAMLRQFLGENIRLHMVGGYTASPKQSEAFFRLAYRLGISDRVHWLDRIANAALADLYRQCAASGGAMLVTSRDESFGMAAAEALLCGCPLIANDLPVFREVLPESPLVQRIDIWKPEHVVRAAQALAIPPSPADVDAMHRNLSERYGPQAFVSSFSTMLGTA